MIPSGVAPIARRMPISCVRSRTITSMMLLTPMTPAASVPMPTTHTRKRMPVEHAGELLVFDFHVPRAERAQVVRGHAMPGAQHDFGALLGDRCGHAVARLDRQPPDRASGVERLLERRQWNVDRLRLLVAALTGLQRAKQADDRERDALDRDLRADRILAGVEQQLPHTRADHRDLAPLGDVDRVHEPSGDERHGLHAQQVGHVAHDAEPAGSPCRA